MNFLVLLLFSYLAVSTNAGGYYATEPSASTDVTSYGNTEVNTEENDSQYVIEIDNSGLENTWSDNNPAETETETQQIKHSIKNINEQNAAVLTESTANNNISFMDVIPFPLNIFWKTVGKDILKSVDVESMCDAVQLVDWKKYQQLLEAEDFVGFQKKITNDEVLSVVAESLQQSTINYMNKLATAITKSMKFEGFENLQNSFKQLFGNFNPGSPIDSSSVNVQKDFTSLLGPMAIYNTVQKEALNNVQKNFSRLIDLIAKAKAQSSVAVSTKSEVSGKNLL